MHVKGQGQGQGQLVRILLAHLWCLINVFLLLPLSNHHHHYFKQMCCSWGFFFCERRAHFVYHHTTNIVIRIWPRCQGVSSKFTYIRLLIRSWQMPQAQLRKFLSSKNHMLFLHNHILPPRIANSAWCHKRFLLALSVIQPSPHHGVHKPESNFTLSE